MNERSPGVWRIRVYTGVDPVTGKKRHASKTFRGTKKGAETALAQLVADVSRGGHREPSSATLAVLLDAYVDHVAGLSKSPTTIDGYRRIVENLRPGIGQNRLDKLSGQDLDTLYAALAERGVPGGRGGLAKASVRKHHAVISAALRQGVKWRWIESNPAARATPPTAPRSQVKAPSPAELRLLIETAGAPPAGRDKGEDAGVHRVGRALLIAFAAATGARRGELLALRWSTSTSMPASSISVAH